MVSKTCVTCRHKVLAEDQQPCFDCICISGIKAFTKWEPIPPKSIEKENNNGNT